MQTLDQFVPNGPLTFELSHLHSDLEIDAGVAKCVITYDRVFDRAAAIYGCQNLTRDLECHLLHMLEIAVVAHPHLHADPERLARHAEVLHHRGRQQCVRHRQEVAVGEREDRGVTALHVRDPALVARVESHIVLWSDLLGENDLNAGKEVAERILQRERDREATDSQCPNERRDVDAEVLQNDEDADHAYGESSRVHHEREGADRSFRAA